MRCRVCIHDGPAHFGPPLHVAGLEVISEKHSRVFLDSEVAWVLGGEADGLCGTGGKGDAEEARHRGEKPLASSPREVGEEPGGGHPAVGVSLQVFASDLPARCRRYVEFHSESEHFTSVVAADVRRPTRQVSAKIHLLTSAATD
jgi:hypothetical protein